jgi:hypothetical protein
MLADLDRETAPFLNLRRHEAIRSGLPQGSRRYAPATPLTYASMSGKHSGNARAGLWGLLAA